MISRVPTPFALNRIKPCLGMGGKRIAARRIRAALKRRCPPAWRNAEPRSYRRTKLLIIGEFALLDDGCPSNKLSRATNFGIPVVSEGLS
jgi:hypothetical protein